MATGDHFEATIFWHLDQRQFMSKWTYEQQNDLTAEENASVLLAEAVNADVVPLMRDAVSSDCQFGCVYARKLDGIRVPNFELNLQNVFGQRASPALPDNCPLYLYRVGTSVTPSARSPLKLSGIAEVDTDGSIADPTYVTAAIDPLLAALDDDISFTIIETATFSPVIQRVPAIDLTDIPGNFTAAANSFARTDGGSFISDGFVTGDPVTFPGNPVNPGPFFPTSVQAATLLLGAAPVQQLGVVVNIRQTSDALYVPVDNSLFNPVLFTQRSRQTTHTGTIGVPAP